ncbi:hypothetical protein HMPREF9565_01633 [Cutibacterium acnes HL053PA2]|uniref:hypothetical protein n=1 Tax=Cutibacterium acnes TaxID=1747 RepID=UPI0001EF42BF|nr:hypothetical protein [Cutibacterium acnes]EFS39974.1 hypothetical protein HMPREF9575_01855 [Cutibacterium acnes HL110PA1]EFT49795.1 hypothetical protein HMPREF9565_01633 [Cutibacterium acnes HL053PA2]EGF00061.1 hypothetical protein HMPREF9584_01838 [Cutibacterium acnes HL092PA1]
MSKHRKPTAADKASRYTGRMAASQGASVSETFQSAKTPITAFNVKLPTATHTALKMRAVEEHTTMNDLLRKALEHTYGFPYDPYQ